VPVRERNVAMVYQQFINYPSMTVADNIASPLKLRGEKGVTERVRTLAARLHIEMFLDRLPAELSGGQQQRVALARALAKNAPLMLLDEPLVNLDYKLREELREELTQLFAAGDSTVVYATTEPAEALLLGGYTAVLDAGELLQYGPTAEVFHTPASIRVARAFSDPPMNLIAGEAASIGVQMRPLPGRPNEGAPSAASAPGAAFAGPSLYIPLPASASRALTLGVRASALRVQARPGDVALPGTVELAEISGSDTFVHVATAVGELVAQLTGVHDFGLGAPITLHLNPAQVYVFDQTGALLVAPPRPAGAR
jgi:glycerol transport system ATP-binding protein